MHSKAMDDGPMELESESDLTSRVRDGLWALLQVAQAIMAGGW